MGKWNAAKRIQKLKETSNKWVARHKASKERAKQSARVYGQRRRDAKSYRDYSSTDVLVLKEQQKQKCIYCGKPLLNGYHIDHIQPISKGGRDTIDNITIACPECNLRKADKTLKEFCETQFYNYEQVRSSIASNLLNLRA